MWSYIRKSLEGLVASTDVNANVEPSNVANPNNDKLNPVKKDDWVLVERGGEEATEIKLPEVKLPEVESPKVGTINLDDLNLVKKEDWFRLDCIRSSFLFSGLSAQSVQRDYQHFLTFRTSDSPHSLKPAEPIQTYSVEQAFSELTSDFLDSLLTIERYKRALSTENIIPHSIFTAQNDADNLCRDKDFGVKGAQEKWDSTRGVAVYTPTTGSLVSEASTHTFASSFYSVYIKNDYKSNGYQIIFIEQNISDFLVLASRFNPTHFSDNDKWSMLLDNHDIDIVTSSESLRYEYLTKVISTSLPLQKFEEIKEKMKDTIHLVSKEYNPKTNFETKSWLKKQIENNGTPVVVHRHSVVPHSLFTAQNDVDNLCRAKDLGIKGAQEKWDNARGLVLRKF